MCQVCQQGYYDKYMRDRQIAIRRNDIFRNSGGSSNFRSGRGKKIGKLSQSKRIKIDPILSLPVECLPCNCNPEGSQSFACLQNNFKTSVNFIKQTGKHRPGLVIPPENYNQSEAHTYIPVTKTKTYKAGDCVCHLGYSGRYCHQCDVTEGKTKPSAQMLTYWEYELNQTLLTWKLGPYRKRKLAKSKNLSPVDLAAASKNLNYSPSTFYPKLSHMSQICVKIDCLTNQDCRNKLWYKKHPDLVTKCLNYNCVCQNDYAFYWDYKIKAGRCLHSQYKPGFKTTLDFAREMHDHFEQSRASRMSCFRIDFKIFLKFNGSKNRVDKRILWNIFGRSLAEKNIILLLLFVIF